METCSEALKRELYEETTGLGKIEVMELLGILECTWDNKGTPYHEINIVYRVEFETMCELIKSNEEHIEFKWYRLNMLNDLKILPSSLAELIPMWLSSNEKNTILASEMNSKQTDLL
ncbi:NUDIX domain-containing protein [Anaerocolumna sp. AGMB13025]|uniref:NUDIX domain-containing protein n=1 Tax=Anaerocolumna sp. AGMB13025 TaxID=3039116 RepID=UPI00241BF5BE|nr:NUDIX domain-containing protein [Anaerocolumna sp. AGMB13025]WFR58946.1 NUDIX domain-containing protein [Anaerocolumna sp. AGMB13025]